MLKNEAESLFQIVDQADLSENDIEVKIGLFWKVVIQYKELKMMC